ncbi:hemin uptake protein HemP [Tabrizicola sp. TH137]|nr:hemin uptake protein HemP [Tabrizicola sp. TH137]
MTLHSDPRRLTLAGTALRPAPAGDVRLAPALPRSALEAAPLHDARVLTKGGVQARIALDGQVYALRITRAGKLILTK